MKGLHSGVFFLAGNFINYSAFRILRIHMFYRVENESLQIKGFKIDTKKWATEINKIYVSFCWQENSPDGNLVDLMFSQLQALYIK